MQIGLITTPTDGYRSLNGQHSPYITALSYRCSAVTLPYYVYYKKYLFGNITFMTDFHDNHQTKHYMCFIYNAIYISDNAINKNALYEHTHSVVLSVYLLTNFVEFADNNLCLHIILLITCL